MSDFRVLSTNHTSFTVSNLDRICAFFGEALGFEVTSKAPRDPKAIESVTGVAGAQVMIAYVRGAGHSIELIEYLAPAGRTQMKPRPCDVGFAHVAFDVDNVDAAVTAAGRHQFAVVGAIHVIDKGPNAGCRVVYLRDSDGVTVEFIEKKVHGPA